MAALNVLVRLAKQAADQSQAALREIDQAIAALERRIDQLGLATRKEASFGADVNQAGATLPAYRRANRREVDLAKEQIEGLMTKRERQMLDVRAKRTELKRFELLIERRDRAVAKEQSVREQKQLDDLIAARLGRRGQR